VKTIHNIMEMIMRIFTVIIILMLIVSGITTLFSYHTLISENIDAVSYDKINTIAFVSAVVTFLSLVLVVVRVIIMIYHHISHRD